MMSSDTQPSCYVMTAEYLHFIHCGFLVLVIGGLDSLKQEWSEFFVKNRDDLSFYMRSVEALYTLLSWDRTIGRNIFKHTYDNNWGLG